MAQDIATQYNIPDTDYTTLRNKMDKAYNVYQLEKYVLTGSDAKPLKNVSNVTLPLAAIFGDAYLADMAADKMMMEVTGVDETIQAEIENEIKDKWLPANDIVISDQTDGDCLKNRLDWLTGFRGGVGGLILMYKDGDKYLPSLMPLDPRWMKWERGTRGMKWGEYETGMSRAIAEEKYKRKLKGEDKKNVTLGQVWDENDWIIYDDISSVNGSWIEIDRKPHNMGFCPIILSRVNIQPLIIANGNSYADQLAAAWPSIYEKAIDLIEKLHEFASVWATMNRRQFETPVAITGIEDKELPDRPFGNALVLQLPDDAKVIEMPSKEMTASAMAQYRELFTQWEMTTYSTANLGQIGNREPALAYQERRGDKRRVLDPRRRCIAKWYHDAVRLLSRQIREGKCFNTDIVEDEAFTINKELFKDKFSCKFEFDSTTPMENMSNAQFAGNLYSLGLFSKKYLLTNIMHDSDPAGTLREAKQDRLYSIIPALELADAAIELTKDRPKQEEIDEMKLDLIRVYLNQQKQMLEQQALPAGKPQPALPQGSIKAPPGQGSSIESQVKQMENNSGQTAITAASRRK